MHLVVYMGIWKEISFDSTIGQGIEHGWTAMMRWKNHVN